MSWDISKKSSLENYTSNTETAQCKTRQHDQNATQH